MTAHIAQAKRHEALGRLADRRLHRELAYVDGHWTASASGQSFEVTDPASGASLAWVASLDADQATMAVEAAARAFPGWRNQLPQQRSKILRRWFELIVAAKDDLALLMTLEQGKPLKESLGEIDYAASFVEWYAEEAKRLNAEGVTSHLPGADRGVSVEGCATTVQPAASAAAALRASMAAGKFHGVATPTTPTGSRRTDISAPGR